MYYTIRPILLFFLGHFLGIICPSSHVSFVQCFLYYLIGCFHSPGKTKPCHNPNFKEFFFCQIIQFAKTKCFVAIEKALFFISKLFFIPNQIKGILITKLFYELLLLLIKRSLRFKSNLYQSCQILRKNTSPTKYISWFPF